MDTITIWRVEVWSRGKDGKSSRWLFEADYEIEARTAQDAINDVKEMGWGDDKDYRASPAGTMPCPA